jgi:hypothetical protein
LCIPPRALYALLHASSLDGRFGATYEWSQAASFYWSNVTIRFADKIQSPAGYWWKDTEAEAVAVDMGVLYGETTSRIVVCWMNKEVGIDACVGEILHLLGEANPQGLPPVLATTSSGYNDEIFVGAYANQLSPYDQRVEAVYIAGPYTCPQTRVALAETAMLGAQNALAAAGELVSVSSGGASRTRLIFLCATLVFLTLVVYALK